MSSDNETWIQFPKQDSTIFHFDSSKRDSLDAYKLYYFKIAVYVGSEKKFSNVENYCPCSYLLDDSFFDLNLDYYNSKYGSMSFLISRQKYCPSQRPSVECDSFKTEICNIDGSKNITKIYDSQIFKYSDNYWRDESGNDTYSLGIPALLDNTIYFEYYKDGEIVLDFFRNYTNDIRELAQ